MMKMMNLAKATNFIKFYQAFSNRISRVNRPFTCEWREFAEGHHDFDIFDNALLNSKLLLAASNNFN